MADGYEVLTAVYPDYFPMVPSNIKKGSSNVKGMFKGQYQIYPPIRTLTFSELQISDIRSYVIVQVFKEVNTWYYVITNTGYVPNFRIYIHTKYYMQSTYGGGSWLNAYAYVDISAGSKGLGYKYSFTPTMISGTLNNLNNYYSDYFYYGIGQGYVSASETEGSTYYDTTFNSILYRVCAWCASPSSHLSSNSVYKFYIDDSTYYPDKIYCATNAFTITYQTGTNSWKSINVPSSNNGTSAFGYVQGDYFWLYDNRMPRFPNPKSTSSSDPKLKIYNVSGNPSTSNSWHYLSAYFSNRLAPTLENYYQNLTGGNASKINLFDYGVISSQLTSYRYEIPTSKLYEIKKGSQYEWDFTSAESTFYLTPFGTNVANGFYILGLYLVPAGESFYVTFAAKQGGNTTGSLSNYNANNLSVGAGNGLAGTISYGLNEPDKFDIGITGTYFDSCSIKTSGGSDYDRRTWGKPNGSTTYNLGTYQQIIHIKGLSNIGYCIFRNNTKIYCEFGVDWFWTWATAKYDTVYNSSLSEYFSVNPTAAYSSSNSATYKDFTVYCICWSGYYQQKTNQISVVKLGNFRVKSKASTANGVIVCN